ncbi:MAG TPA: radical SAM protein [Gemmatimonadales bacterium]|jgi:DNA repair photolyase
MRVGAMRVNDGGQAVGRSERRARQLPLLPSADSPVRPTAAVILDERLRGTKFVQLAPRSVLNSPQQTGVDFWSLNPFVGCEFGCSYCYARYAHRYVVERAHDAGRLSGAEFRDAFERRIFVKQDLLGALERDLQRYFRSAGPSVGATAPIVIGTATDPYQPGERRFRVTRRVLERLARCEGLNIGIITKSPLVTRDIDVLRRIAARSDLEVHVSLTTVDSGIIRRLEARSPMPAARLRALHKLTSAGVNAGVIVAPVLPGITDDVPHLEALFQAAREAGARFIHAGPLRLYAAVRERFLPVVDAHFPHLSERYRRAYAHASGAPRAYAAALARRMRRLQRRFGFPENEGMRDRYRRRLPPAQGALDV